MNPSNIDRAFGGSIPELYERYLVPLIFEPCAGVLASRAALREASHVLEIAAGTGVVTRQLARVLPDSVAIVATDLNEPMLKEAKRRGTIRPVEWQQADAMLLPYSDQYFDLVICQFGVMFFSDKQKAFLEIKRVLRPGGCFIFNVWDRIEENEFAYVITEALTSLFPSAPPRFLARIPHGYHDPSQISSDLRSAGFVATPQFTTLTMRSRAENPHIPAAAYCQGTPLRSEIEAHGHNRLFEATATAAAAIESRFGSGRVEGKIQAHLVTVER